MIIFTLYHNVLKETNKKVLSAELYNDDVNEEETLAICEDIYNYTSKDNWQDKRTAKDVYEVTKGKHRATLSGDYVKVGSKCYVKTDYGWTNLHRSNLDRAYIPVNSAGTVKMLSPLIHCLVG